MTTIHIGNPLLQHALALGFFIALFVAFYAPAIFTGHLLAPGDGSIYYLPHYEMPSTLWDPGLMTGFPEAADPQLMTWYAPRFLLSLIPGSWNAFVIAAYVLASWFTYLFFWVLGEDGFAAIVSGTVYGLSGFLVAHLGHTTIIHAAAWIPAMLLAAEQLARGLRVRWIVVGGVAAAQCILAGHPQITLYGLALTGAYFVFRALQAGKGRAAYCGAFLSMMVLALMLTALQTLTTGMFAAITPRATKSLEQYSAFSTSIYQLILLLFPCLFGGAGATVFDGIPFFAAWGGTETAGYVGFGVLVLGAIALCSFWRNGRVLFWAGAALVAVLAAMGPGTLLGRLIYEVPGFGQFRAPARFMGIFGFCMAILAGYGILAIRKNPRSLSHLVAIPSALIALVAAAAVVVTAFGPQLHAAAASKGFPSLSFSIAGNRWLQIPLISGVVVTLLLLLYWSRPRNRVFQILLLSGILCESGTFSWFAQWRFGSPLASDMKPPASVREDARVLRQSGGRWLLLDADQGRLADAPPDLSALWKLPSIGKYGPLLPTRYSDVLEIRGDGLVYGNWWDSRDRALDLAGARLFAVNDATGGTATAVRGSSLSNEINILAGRGCGSTVSEAKIALTQPQRIASIRMVSMLGCSTGIEQGAPVLAMRFHGAGGIGREVILRAGIDTAEWAATCADVVPAMHHRPAEVVSRFPVTRGGVPCQAQRYGTVAKLAEGAMDVQSIDLEWLPKSEGIIRIVSMVFSDELKHTHALDQSDFRLGDRSRWRQVYRDGDRAVYENLHALPRCWLVPETVTLDPADVKASIKTSVLPNRRAYDPRSMALIEDPLVFHSAADPDARAWVVSDRKTDLDIETVSRQPAFLVVGDFNFPGWRVLVNGQPSRVFQTNYIQRGVLLPAGPNRVRFEFRPASFYAGLVVSGAGVLAALAALWLSHRRGAL